MTDDLREPAREPARDPYATPEAAPAGRRPLAIAGFVLAVLALVIVPPVTGSLAMICGLTAHVKGDRLGFKAAIAGGIAMILGMALDFFITR